MSKKLCEKKVNHKAEKSKKKFTCKKCGLYSNSENKLCKAIHNQ